MKIAFCFLTYDELDRPDIWKNFLNNNSDKYNIYIHPKYANNIKDPYFKNFVINNRVVTNKKSDISIVTATLRLFEEAYKNKENSKIIFLSQSCAPLMNFNKFYSEIMGTGNMVKVFYNNFNRILKYTQLSPILQQKIPINLLVKQHPQMILDRDTVSFFLKYNFTDHFKRMQCPDEHYFINMILLHKIPFNNRQICFCNPVLTRTQAIVQKSLTTDHVRQLLNYGFMFARKIDKTTKTSYHLNNI